MMLLPPGQAKLRRWHGTKACSMCASDPNGATWRLEGNKFSDRSGAFGAPGCSMVL